MAGRPPGGGVGGLASHRGAKAWPGRSPCLHALRPGAPAGCGMSSSRRAGAGGIRGRSSWREANGRRLAPGCAGALGARPTARRNLRCCRRNWTLPGAERRRTCPPNGPGHRGAGRAGLRAPDTASGHAGAGELRGAEEGGHRPDAQGRSPRRHPRGCLLDRVPRRVHACERGRSPCGRSLGPRRRAFGWVPGCRWRGVGAGSGSSASRPTAWSCATGTSGGTRFAMAVRVAGHDSAQAGPRATRQPRAKIPGPRIG